MVDAELALDAGNPNAPKLPAGALQTRTDVGKPGYIGPCPPEGDHPHRYIFTIFAVSQETLPVINNTKDRRIIGYLSEAYALRRYAHELERHRGGRGDDAGIFSPGPPDAPPSPEQPQNR